MPFILLFYSSVGIKQAHSALKDLYKSPGQQRSGSLSKLSFVILMLGLPLPVPGLSISSSFLLRTQRAATTKIHAHLLARSGLRGWGHCLHDDARLLSSAHTVRICRAADILPLKHTALLWQRTARSDSVLLSLEITQTTPKISTPFASIRQLLNFTATNYPYRNTACFMQLQVTQDHQHLKELRKQINKQTKKTSQKRKMGKNVNTKLENHLHLK